MNLPKQIRKYREQLGLSQEGLAEKIFVSRQTISNWETERSYPDINSLLLLSVLFDVSLDELVKGDLEMMKKELQNQELNKWTYVMLTFMLLAFIAGIPMIFIFKTFGWILFIGLISINLIASIKIEILKKRLNLKTYREILAFSEGRSLNDKKTNAERKYYWKERVIKFVGGGVLALIIIGIMKALVF
ncbi:helix-turn-helix domain-containing protein [Agrilactobacillus fermenti]|uniref:helix-turn-helix domain-containing protein n=1 Tax=Agrilactobacillus fermenti TaxID=2586909 RepID=UPI001E3572CE|nr:helix-turn-helix transcriptional regulator [Agrilactobacillus fermenti]MCD2255621.1 helix-turn-helix transcriptional regulator [Agrilactobacillus fermenti]